MKNNSQQLIAEQDACARLRSEKVSREEIAEKLGLSVSAVKRRLAAFDKRARLDPEIADRLMEQGVTDFSGLHSGWILNKDKDGSGQSLYFYLGPDQEKVSFAEAIMEVLSDIPKLPKIQKPKISKDEHKKTANWIALADLHVGGDYNDPVLEEDFEQAVDHLIHRLPTASHAVLFELGDLMEVNDHKGITPGSGNHLEAKIGPGEFLKSVQVGIRLVRRLMIGLLQTHETLEVHFVKGNHDPTAHLAVLLALAEHFADNPRVNVVVTGEEFRVVSWGKCAAFPHHGDTIKWPELKDVFADQFPNEWAAATSYRLLMTAHYHHDRRRDLIGCTAEHFQVLHRPNNWAKARGFISRGSISAMTIHAERGYEHRTISNIRNTIMGSDT